MNRKQFSNICSIGLFCVGTVLVSCSGENTNGQDDSLNTVDQNIIDSTKSQNLVLDGEMFSLPSPFQTAMVIERSGADYRPEITNEAAKASNYMGTFKKALNLGVYGADLGYCSIYSQSKPAIQYLTSAEKLSRDLGVSGAFDKVLIERISNNIDNRDTMMILVSEAFRAGDAYLKNNDRNDEAILVLAGGWIESLYITAVLTKDLKTQDMIGYLGDQKSALERLIRVLAKRSASNTDYKDLAKQLQGLLEKFDKARYSYTFVPSEHNEAEKMTTIKSQSTVELPEEALADIATEITSIRNSIIN